ncbi:hypothetical protein SCHPADRAFT_999697 [Schizopora paradoxa]|uniref:TRP C-terminal domain-containing protein n=1 Tax=Schizopora paradoxa TaxID=27342 RepID=A0A0H2RF78_9AGAM|nr:hypothetical protein SCHPADRAFT_999697 [Schizopora paradoxa]
MKHRPCSSSSTISFFLALFLSFFASIVAADPALLSFTECTEGNAIASNLKINISEVYGQVVTDDILGRHLNFTLIGNTGQEITPESNTTGLEATLFTSSSVLTFSVFSNSTFFCSSLVPPSPLPTPDAKNLFCPLAVGPLAFSAAVPLGDHSYELLTINTRLRVVDTSQPAIELACVDIAATPLNGQEKNGTLYGPALIIFWVSVGLAIAYWIIVGTARIVAAWDRGGSGPSRTLWSRIEGAGFMLASAISGEKLSGTPALLRFCTPSMRDIVFHTQFCASMGLVAVQWPLFAYPFFAQTSWSMLTYNVTLTQGGDADQKHWNPLTVQPYDPPSNFADQLNDSSSPIFLDPNAPNTLLMLPPNATNGIESFAAAVGLRPEDLFGNCLSIFLMIVAGTVILSLLIWLIDHFAASLFGRGDREERGLERGPAFRSPSKDADKSGISTSEEDGTEQGLLRTTSRPLTLTNTLGRSLWHYRIRPNSFHGNILHGNLVRLLMLFHLPVTLFSCYQFTTGRSDSTIASVVLAVLAFVVFSISLPLVLIIRLWNTATNKLYDETRTLMMLGPLYNHYGQGSQLFACMFFACNLIYGVTIGCGQKSGTAQAIVLLVTEVVSSLSTSVWLPWGRGAGMGLISFCFCVARIMVAVLLVILSPTVSIGTSAEGWVTNAILFILGLIYLAFILILVVKLIEASMRIFGRIPFDRSNHTLDSGFFGVLGLLNCLGRKRRRRRAQRRSPPDTRSSTIVLGSPSALKKDSTPRSSTNGPPSVLRPEHAFLPYREDTDDEGGYIMGSWQAFPQPGYGLVEDRAPSPPVEAAAVPPPTTKSGFTRLGGGKAHFDSPYAIQTSSPASTPKHEFPSTERIAPLPAQSIPSPSPTPPPPFRNVGAETPSNRSTVTVNHQVASGLPPGAMSPARPAGHVRTKSQTAIIEDASVFFTNLNEGASGNAPSSSGAATAQAPGTRDDPLLPPQILVEDDGGDSSDTTEPRKGHWFNFRKNRRMSASEATPMTPTTPEEPASARSEGSGAGRSFVVVRAKRPGSSGAEAQTKPARTKRPASADGQLLSPSLSDPSRS